MKHTMHETNGHSSLYGMIITGLFQVLAVITVQQWAAVATIFAGFSTGAFTLYKWWRIHTNKSKPDE